MKHVTRQFLKPRKKFTGVKCVNIYRAQEKGQIFKIPTSIYQGTTTALHIYYMFTSLGAVFAGKVLLKIGTFWHAYRADILVRNIAY